MIQLLILNPLLACAQQEKPIVETPATSIPQKPSGKVIIIDTLSTPKPSNFAEDFHSTWVRLSNIPYPRASFNDDLFCTYICNYANNGQGNKIIKVDNCRVELISDWEEQRKDLTTEEITQKGDPIVGAVECVAYFVQTW